MLPLYLGCFDWILFILTGNDNIQKSLDELEIGQIRPLVSIATDRVIMAKTVSPLFPAVFHPILFILADNNDMHENSEELEIWPDLTTNCGVSCP